MDNRTRKKICGAVLTLAASGFGFDQWTGGASPAGSDAAQAAVASQSSYPPNPPAVAAPTKESPMKVTPGKETPTSVGVSTDRSKGTQPMSLASRLQAVAAAEQLDLTDVPDAFRAGKLESQARARSGAAPAAPPPPDPAVEFRAHHRLTAVMKAGRAIPGGGLAMVDGKTVTPGQSVDGFVLVAVHESSAVFRHDGVHVELALDMPGHARPAAVR